MIIIAEKINGSIPSVAKAIEAKDADFIKNLAKVQTEAGADFIDVCASVEVSKEVEILKGDADKRRFHVTPGVVVEGAAGRIG